ncbi:MAG: hypothetical protein H0S85_16305 [Desulfovibrionaceae bacterium]|nr:hypothetical protein [Desulfovibrionaceae bacterium]
MSRPDPRIAKKIKKIATAVLLALAVWACIGALAEAHAETRSFEITRTCHMGDNETRDRARTLCFLQAKRDLLEKAGTFVQAVSESRNFELTRDEINSYSAALVQADIVDEKLTVTNGALAITMTVRAEVDGSVLQDRLDRIAADAASRALADQALRREQDAARSAVGPHEVPAAQWSPTPAQPASPAPGTAQSTSRPRTTPSSPEELQAAQRAVLEQISGETRAARSAVAKGMTQAEVASLLGPARSRKELVARSTRWTCEAYGYTWVVYRDGLVACTRTRLEYSKSYQGDCHCSGSGMDFIVR